MEKQYVPQMYILHFSESERDIESVIRELLLDSNVLDAYTNRYFLGNIPFPNQLSLFHMQTFRLSIRLGRIEGTKRNSARLP